MDKENKKHHCDCGCEHEYTHDEHCDCGCDDCNDDIVELTADDGRKLKFYFLSGQLFNNF